jgi:pimeloyl-ACP methyl ester carboxylesterase
MMDDFETAEIQTGETSIFACWSGSGPPILLLHGFPQTHLMWRSVAPMLARDFTLVCPDLRGYGRSGCPASTRDHAPYAKRAMARDMVAIMEQLGFPRFSVAGHDRGGRVAYRLARDHPDRVDRPAVLDILPTATVWDRADARFALAYWPCSLLAQPEPLPERILAGAAEAIVDDALGGWGSPAAVSPRRCVRPMSRPLGIPRTPMLSVRNIEPPRRSITRMIRRIAWRGDALPALSWHSGARTGHLIRGMQGPVDHSRCGKRGATMCEATRSARAIFSRKRLPNTRPKLWTAFSPLTRGDGGNRTKAWSQPPPASARSSLPLSAAAHTRRWAAGETLRGRRFSR